MKKLNNQEVDALYRKINDKMKEENNAVYESVYKEQANDISEQTEAVMQVLARMPLFAKSYIEHHFGMQTIKNYEKREEIEEYLKYKVRKAVNLPFPNISDYSSREKIRDQIILSQVEAVSIQDIIDSVTKSLRREDE